MLRTACLLACLVACSSKHTSPDASFASSMIQGDACAANVDRFRCAMATGCSWTTIGAQCPGDGSYCQAGVCSVPPGGGIGIQGTCTCGSGQLCFEQIAGAVVAANVQCTGGTACAQIASQGTCKPSTFIQGLCVCDSGT